MFSDGDHDFHASVATASHNMFLAVAVQEARRLQLQSNVIGKGGSVGPHGEKAVEEHDAIYRAIRAGEPKDAALSAAAHIDNTLDDYRQEIQQRIFSRAP